VAATLTELSRAEIAAGPKQAARAPANLGRVIRILEATASFPETAIDARVLRAELARRKGEVAAARSDLTVAAELVESLRPRAGGGEATRAAFMAKHAIVYEELVELALTRGQIASAFEWMERSRGRALLDQLVAGGVDVLSGVAEPRRSELRRRQAATRTSLAEWQARADALLVRDDLEPSLLAVRTAEARKERAAAAAELRRVDEETKNESALWRSASGGRPVTLDTARSSLFPREIMLAYQIGERASWLIQIPRSYDEPAAWPLSVSASEASVLGVAPGPLTRASLEKILDGPAGLLAEIARRPVPGFPDDAPRALAALYDVLLPKAARATTATRWAGGYTVIPDGPLARLPFEALVVKSEPDGAPRYWLDEDAPIRYAVSSTLLTTLSARPLTASNGLLSVADPTYKSPRWPRLPGTASESEAVVAAIRRGSHEMPVTILRGAAASKAAVRDALSGKRFIHLAVHAVVDEGRGDLLAGLALADDELLQLFEIYELDLDADLAVLSACATGRGTAVAGEGVFALGRGFLARGARRVVASHWEVDDASTATLFAAFFEALPNSGADEDPSPNYAAALASAKRTVRNDPADGGAVLLGAPFVLGASPVRTDLTDRSVPRRASPRRSGREHLAPTGMRPPARVR
jgi:CHAT domain-containing protein